MGELMDNSCPTEGKNFSLEVSKRRFGHDGKSEEVEVGSRCNLPHLRTSNPVHPSHGFQSTDAGGFWELLEDSRFWRSRPDWLLIILDSIRVDMRAKLLLLLWRSWFLRNDSVHATVEWVKQPLILETDCASLVKMMTSPDFERAHLCHTLRSIKSLSAVLLGFRIQKVKRECNSVAHELAKLAMHTNHSVVWRM
ncbi:hypothetical protein OsI_10893 [Oryza sativa Indica Group]|uniref:RNase H type-1 domain-containing protein n=1 Tax=Oryza sativa subsp. indica TaxID=39946 RepID=A2XEX7_ORYSI|nr:hypothetical protein OsI_10893 [Oryza sativa Indica Group]